MFVYKFLCDVMREVKQRLRLKVDSRHFSGFHGDTRRSEICKNSLSKFAIRVKIISAIYKFGTIAGTIAKIDI